MCVVNEDFHGTSNQKFQLISDIRSLMARELWWAKIKMFNLFFHFQENDWRTTRNGTNFKRGMQIEKTMTSGSLLCSVTFFIFSVVRQLIVAVSRVVENDYVSTGLNFNENIQLINLARSLSFIFAALNMPIVFLLFIVQNLDFREQLKKEFCSLRVFCQKPHQKTTEYDTSKASAVQRKGNTWWLQCNEQITSRAVSDPQANRFLNFFKLGYKKTALNFL